MSRCKKYIKVILLQTVPIFWHYTVLPKKKKLRHIAAIFVAHVTHYIALE